MNDGWIDPDTHRAGYLIRRPGEGDSTIYMKTWDGRAWTDDINQACTLEELPRQVQAWSHVAEYAWIAVGPGGAILDDWAPLAGLRDEGVAPDPHGSWVRYAVRDSMLTPDEVLEILLTATALSRRNVNPLAVLKNDGPVHEGLPALSVEIEALRSWWDGSILDSSGEPALSSERLVPVTLSMAKTWCTSRPTSCAEDRWSSMSSSIWPPEPTA